MNFINVQCTKCLVPTHAEEVRGIEQTSVAMGTKAELAMGVATKKRETTTIGSKGQKNVMCNDKSGQEIIKKAQNNCTEGS